MYGLENWIWALDGWIVVAGILCAVASSLLGNFLVLRRMSMLGDAISHAVLPGLAGAFLLTGTRDSIPMFIGAALVGVLTAFFTEWIRKHGKVDEGAAMGVVFTALFAFGLLMIVQAADKVDLDPGCVLYGAIELTPLNTTPIAGWEVPRVVIVLAIVLVVNLCAVLLFYKELKLSSFDPALATTLGINSSLMHYLLMTLVAVTAVASFEAVGNILVVAMFVVPPATAYLCTDRLGVMIGLSALFAALAAIAGHAGAIVVPHLFGFRSTTTSGMMAVATGVFLGVAVLVAPRYGVLMRWARRIKLSSEILADDIVALLYRREERGDAEAAGTVAEFRELLVAGNWSLTMVVRELRRKGLLVDDGGRYRLTAIGRQRAQELVRSHRLWEQYLVDEAGRPSDRIHLQAEQLEHFTDRGLRRELDHATANPTLDPHGAPIPPET